jgi:hypothetical protein
LAGSNYQENIFTWGLQHFFGTFTRSPRIQTGLAGNGHQGKKFNFAGMGCQRKAFTWRLRQFIGALAVLAVL